MVYRSLANHPEIRVRISGHTDSIGTDNYNKELSRARAAAVKQYLVNRGIDAGRISTVGYGENRPVAPNSMPEGRAKNRRIEIVRID